MEYPKRKPNRLKGYDYSQNGAYFITICTKDRKNLLWNNVGATIGRPYKVELSECGLITDDAIKSIPEHYPNISVDKYVIMPNHIYMILSIESGYDGRPMVAPTISRMMGKKGIYYKSRYLYESGLISNNEYQEKRRKIIDSI